jgi:hypothetical protein
MTKTLNIFFFLAFYQYLINFYFYFIFDKKKYIYFIFINVEILNKID